MKIASSIKTLKIDDRDFSARQDETILDVARQNDIFIPTLCDLKGLSPVGACRLCLVEVKGNNKLVAACVTRVEEGMEVTTNSERLQRHRRNLLELLFTERNHICSVCVSKRPLRTANPGPETRHYPRPLSLSLSAASGGRVARALLGRPQPLHSVLTLCAGLRRNRRCAHLGRDGARHPGPGHHRSGRTLGHVPNLHRVW